MKEREEKLCCFLLMDVHNTKMIGTTPVIKSTTKLMQPCILSKCVAYNEGLGTCRRLEYG